MPGKPPYFSDVNAKSLAATLGFLGIVLPGTLTLIFKNGCTQDNSTTTHSRRSNSPATSHLLREGRPGNPSTDISTNLLQHAATIPKGSSNEIP
jgi:hypothetical protein